MRRWEALRAFPPQGLGSTETLRKLTVKIIFQYSNSIQNSAFKKINTGRPRPVEIEIPPEALSELSYVQNYKKTQTQTPNISKKSLDKAKVFLKDNVDNKTKLDDAVREMFSRVLEYIEYKKDGTIMKSEILDHERMNRPGQKFYKILAESALRAVRICQPLKVPPTGYERWKDLQLNFDPTEMLKG